MRKLVERGGQTLEVLEGRERSDPWAARFSGRISEYGVIYAFVALFLILSFSSPVFLSSRNLLNVADSWAPVALIALGGTVVLLAGGFDLSIGGMYVLSSVMCAYIAVHTNPYLGLVGGVAAGVLLGGVNGLLITVGRMNPFVATIGSTIVFSGIAVVITDGFIIAVPDIRFNILGHQFLGVYISIYVMTAAVMATALLINRTTFGRYVRAIGGNTEAARLSGIRINWVTIGAYAICGASCGIAAAIVASGSMSSTNSTSINFSVWAALLLGGNSIAGGVGSVWRTMFGVGVLALLQNGFTLIGVGSIYQQVTTGVIFLLAVLLDSRIRRAYR